ncbi:hypothetical protein F4678DRAFT_462986 [Xylaria arbuscula]|nr:hypothetical protein F4678DRAFT_462986 [Xylaria arbuscula]
MACLVDKNVMEGGRRNNGSTARGAGRGADASRGTKTAGLRIRGVVFRSGARLLRVSPSPSLSLSSVAAVTAVTTAMGTVATIRKGQGVIVGWNSVAAGVGDAAGCRGRRSGIESDQRGQEWTGRSVARVTVTVTGTATATRRQLNSAGQTRPGYGTGWLVWLVWRRQLHRRAVEKTGWGAG